MSLLKKFTAAAAALAISLSLASCGKDTSWGADIDGSRLRAGILIYFQSSALSEAYTQLQEGEEDVLAATIEGQPAKDWINNKAVEKMRRYAAIENKFSELGLSFRNKEDEMAKLTAEQWWEYLGEYYEHLGISEQSYIDVTVNAEKELRIFDHYYGEGGEAEIPEEKIRDYLLENNVRIKYIEMPLKDGEGNILKSDDKAEIRKMADDYIARMKNGESFETIAHEYEAYYASLSASGEETASGEDTVTSFDGDDNYEVVITKTSVFPSADVAAKAFSDDFAVGSYTVVEEFETDYIVYKMDLFADEDYLESHRSMAAHALSDDEFNELVESWISAQNVTINNDSLDRYKIDNLMS